MNRSLFSFDPKTNQIKKFGNILGIGNVDSIAKSREKLYLGLYYGGKIGIIDLKDKKAQIIGNPVKMATRITVLESFDKENMIIGGTSCERPNCGDSSLFIYSITDQQFSSWEVDGAIKITSISNLRDGIFFGTYPNGKIIEFDLLNKKIKRTEIPIEDGKNVIIGKEYGPEKSKRDFLVVSVDDKLLKIDKNDLKKHTILNKSNSGIITDILIVKDKIYYSTKGGELLTTDVGKGVNYSYGFIVSKEEQITKLAYANGYIVGGTYPNGYLFKLKI